MHCSQRESRAAALNSLLSGEELFTCRREITPWKQRFSWDCGIACVAMCLPVSTRHELYEKLGSLKQTFGFNNTTWTVDLCFVLDYFGVEFRYVTNYSGVNPQLEKHAFYRSSFARDRRRVVQAFADAEGKNIRISIRKIYLEEILEHVFLKGPVIVLVNSHMLHCIDCSSKMNCISCCFRRRYQGHYILVIGFDLKNSWIYYYDPIYGNRTCKVTIEDFDRARISPGTDWDTILIENCPSKFDGLGDGNTGDS